MNKDRLNTLLELYSDDKSDSFVIYGIALEYAEEHPDQAKEYFTILLNKHENYLPTYCHAGMNLIKLNEIEPAYKVVSKGIEIAINANDNHAKSELEFLLEDIEDALP